MLPLENVPDWSREVERTRRNLGLTCSEIGIACGKGAYWWAPSMQKVTPPNGWPKLYLKIARYLKKVGG